MNSEIVLAYISFGSVLIPLGLYASIKFNINLELRPLVKLLVVALLCDLGSLGLIQYSINTYPIGNFYLFAQFSILYYLFINYLRTPKILIWVFILFCLFYLLNISFFQGPLQFNSITNVFASLILILLSLYYLFSLLKKLPTVHIHRLPLLWVSFAALTYYGGNFFLFLLSDYLTRSNDGSLAIMWTMHNFLNIIKNILFAIAIWQASRSPKLSI